MIIGIIAFRKFACRLFANIGFRRVDRYFRVFWFYDCTLFGLVLIRGCVLDNSYIIATIKQNQFRLRRPVYARRKYYLESN